MTEPGPLQALQPVLLGLLGELSVQGVFQRLADSARSLVGASEAAVRLSAPGWAPLAIASGKARALRGGDDPPPPPVPLDTGAGPDPPGAEPSDPPAGRWSAQLLSVRVLANGADLGELVLSRKVGGAFTEEDEGLVAVLAVAAGAAAWNARLYEESQQRQRWLVATMGAATDLVQSEGLMAGRELDLVAERALRASQSVLALVAVPEAESFRIAAAAGTVPSRRLLAAVAERLREPAGHAQDGQAAEWFGKDAARGLGPVLAVRLGDSIPPGSVLVLARGEGGAYTRSDISAAALFGAHTGRALRLRVLARERDSDAVAADRRRISRALNDLVTPRLVATGLSLRRLSLLAPAAGASVLIEEIARQLETAIQDVRQAAKALGSTDEPREQETASFSGALLQAVGALDGHRDFEARITIEGSTEGIPAQAQDRLLALTAEVFSAVRADHSRARASLIVDVGEDGADLVVQDETRRARDRSPSTLAETLAIVASRVSGASLSSAESGARLDVRVPFDPGPSQG